MRLFILSILLFVYLGNLSGQCTITVTPRPTPDEVECSCEVEDIPMEFIGIPPDNSTDVAVFESLGFTVNSTGACGDIYITARDFPTHPTSCSDTFYILRRYDLASPFGGQTQVAIDTFFTQIIPPHFIKKAVDSTITCKDDVAVEYQDFLDNYSYSDFLPCYPQTKAEYFPDADPVLAALCGGSRFVRALLRLSGPCTAKCLALGAATGTNKNDIAQTISNFTVIDTFKTIIDCPTVAPLNVSDPDIETIISDALEDYNLFFECDRPVITNTFVLDSLNNRRFECDPDPLIITVDATADCAMNSHFCFVTLNLINDTPPTITDVPPTLFLECGDPTNLTKVNAWLASTRATDYLGNSVSTLSNNFDFSILSSVLCNSSYTITFTAIDNCGRTDSQNGIIEMLDTQDPVILSCPSDTIVNADDPNLVGAVRAWLDGFNAIDNCNPLFQAFHNFDEGLLAFNCGRIDTVVTFTADDLCIETNIITCEADLTILDNVRDDFINFPNDTTIQCENPINVPVLAAWSNSVSAANTLGTTFLVDNDLDLMDMRLLQCNESIEVAFRFVNQCGVETIEIARLDVTDDIPPTVTCPNDITINDQSGDVDLAVTAWLGTALPQDNCSATTGNAYDSFLFSDCTRDTITNPIIFWAQDECGNRSLANCESNLTLITQKEPKITCPQPLVLECGSGNIMDTIQSWIASAEGTNFLGDDIGTTNDLILANLDTLACLNETMVEFIAEDLSCQRMTDCTAMITIRDIYAPTIICPAGLTISSTSPTIDADIQTWLESPITEDNSCETPLLFNDFVPSADYCTNGQTINVVFIVKDKCDLQNSCAGLITVDTNPATLSCPSQELELECGDDNNIALISAWIMEATALDNNGMDLSSGISTDFNTNSLDTSCVQTIPVQFLVSDICTNESDCQMNIVIRDSQAPDVTCPTIPLNLLGGDTTKLPKFISWLELVPVEDCNGYMITEDFDDSLLAGFSCTEEDYPITITFTDDCGWISTCQAQISIQNNIQTSFINCSPATDNFSVECGSPNFEDEIKDWMALVSAEDIFGSSFPTTPDLDFSDPRLSECGAMIPIVFELVDLCGNSQDCGLSLTIVDTTDPIPSCPQDTTFMLEDPDFTVNVANWLASVSGIDDCNSLIQEQSDYSAITALDPCEPFRALDVTFTLLDGCGNNATCVSILTVATEKVPAISCPPNQIVECGDIDTEDKINQWLDQVTGEDANSSPLVPQYNFDVADVLAVNCDGQFPILFTITDNCSIQDTCTATIFIQDTTAPDALCPPAITINSTDPSGPQKMQDWIDSYSPIDNCSMAIPSIQNGVIVPSILCNASDEMTVEFYAEDACGLRDTCESIITINKAAPTINCPDDLDIQCGETGNDDQIMAWLDSFSGEDNNEIARPVTNNFTSVDFTNDCESSTPIEFTLTDDCGVVSDCTRLITQKDTLAPDVLICPSDIVLDISETNLDGLVSNWLSTYEASDVCNMVTKSNDYNLLLEVFDCGSDTTVVFTAIDECGNTNTDCRANIAFENNLEVAIECPENIRVKCNDPVTLGTIQDFFQGYTVESKDDWMVETDVEIASLDIECTAIYVQEVVFTITDRCNNTNECSSFIEFIPNASIYIPTIFRPGASSTDDDYFTLRTNIGIEEITSFRIYSRWGDLMFERENFDPNAEKGWNGRNSYGQSVQGVYTYVIIYDDIFGNSFEKLGTITLID